MVALGLQKSRVHCILGFIKHLRVGCLVVALLSFLRNLYGQGFVDLNFESATLATAPPPWGSSSVEFAQAFPGWSESIGLNTNALYDAVPLDTVGISIIDKSFSSWPAWPGPVIQGNYSAVLASGDGYTVNGGGPTAATLSQTGLVPVGTESLQFEANEYLDSPASLVVTLGGQTLTLAVLGTGTNYTRYGADVSQWAGQTANLAFTVLAENPHRGDEYLVLDAIQFSSEPVPEPSVMGLFSISIFCMCGRTKWRNQIIRAATGC